MTGGNAPSPSTGEARDGSGTPAIPRLTGRGIVITRPAEQAASLARLIASEGGRPIVFSAIEILDIEDRRALDALIGRLDAFDLAIFISPNAVERGLSAIHRLRTLPPQLQVAAIGRGSARALHRQGFRSVIAPGAGADSEALLALPELGKLAGKRVVVFRGVGGRVLLRDELAARGAIVEYAECYRRRRPQIDPAALLGAWRRGEVDAVVATSSEGLRNFHDMLGEEGRKQLGATPLVVPHARIASTAQRLGIANAIVTAPGEDGILEGLARYFAASR